MIHLLIASLEPVSRFVVRGAVLQTILFMVNVLL